MSTPADSPAPASGRETTEDCGGSFLNGTACRRCKACARDRAAMHAAGHFILSAAPASGGPRPLRSTAACPEHGDLCDGPDCCCADKHPASGGPGVGRETDHAFGRRLGALLDQYEGAVLTFAKARTIASEVNAANAREAVVSFVESLRSPAGPPRETGSRCIDPDACDGAKACLHAGCLSSRAPGAASRDTTTEDTADA